jgi:hypothetical protein
MAPQKPGKAAGKTSLSLMRCAGQRLYHAIATGGGQP